MAEILDMREVVALGKGLRKARTAVAPELERRLTARANEVMAEARANAPKDRPWLSTPDGIKLSRRRRKLGRTIVSPKDDRGMSVGYRVEYGTSVMPPRPFLTPAFTRGADRFNRDALAVLDAALSDT